MPNRKPAPAPAPAPVTGIVTRSGTQLTLNGVPFRFIGYQIGCAPSSAHPQCGAWSDAQIASAFSHAKTIGANVVRVWMFQNWGGPQDWSRFDLIFAQARAAGLRVLVTLTNGWGDCEPANADGSRHFKTLAWFQSGYKNPDPGYALSFRSFAGAMAARYKAETGLFAWQLVNEAEPRITETGGCDEAAGASAMRTFADDMVGVIRAAGSPHLTSLGTMGGGQCGASGSGNFKLVHAGTIDLCEYHDYTFMQSMPGDQWNGLQTRINDANAIGRPLFIGEVGIPSGIQADGSTGTTTSESLSRRAGLLDSKIAAQRAAGVVGHLVWQKALQNNDGFTFMDGDPLEAVITKHRA